MTFNKCSIAGVCYGDVYDEKTGELMEVNEVSVTVSSFCRVVYYNEIPIAV